MWLYPAQAGAVPPSLPCTPQAPLTNGHPSVAGCQLSPQAWPPEKEQAPLPMALKRLVFGVEALHETFVRVMCSQTYEKACPEYTWQLLFTRSLLCCSLACLPNLLGL